jgi:hypothetical protein
MSHVVKCDRNHFRSLLSNSNFALPVYHMLSRIRYNVSLFFIGFYGVGLLGPTQSPIWAVTPAGLTTVTETVVRLRPEPQGTPCRIDKRPSLK